MDYNLNIISFDVPYPPDYGGVIDIYYKLVALKKAGVKVHLHTFEYGRGKAEELEKVCESVYYYERKIFAEGNFTLLPYIVFSRKSDELTKNLLANNYPVLFEGLHTCYLLNDERFASRIKVYRESNIEHDYYWNLFKTDSSLFNRLFFLAESLRLKLYEKQVRHASLALAVSESDAEYLRVEYPSLQTEYLPSFHPNESVYFSEEKEQFVLFHGNLSVPENFAAAEFLVKEIFSKSKHRLIIAGKNPPERLQKISSPFSNIEVISNPEEKKLTELIRTAQINLLYTERPAGLKLKLLNVLFNGGHCLVNPAMLEGTGLDDACAIASGAKEIEERINELMNKKFPEEQKSKREKLLFPRYSNDANAEKLIWLVWSNNE